MGIVEEEQYAYSSLLSLVSTLSDNRRSPNTSHYITLHVDRHSFPELSNKAGSVKFLSSFVCYTLSSG